MPTCRLSRRELLTGSTASAAGAIVNQPFDALAQNTLTARAKSLELDTRDEMGDMAQALNQAVGRMRTALDQQKTRAEEREKQAIDAVKRFGDVVREEPLLKDNPEMEALRRRLLGR